jgi:prepilin-type N-terminal cleavage/methylation domain-containing protein
MKSVRRELGFTLIELLIVVAIIAILAAIAVPNFLEAQTRAKVARVKADQRSAATAVESYMIDYNSPPMDRNNRYWGPTDNNNVYKAEFPPLPPAPFTDYMAHLVWQELTTPIAYITSPMRDPFRTGNDTMTSYRQNSEGLLDYMTTKWQKYLNSKSNLPFWRNQQRNCFNYGYSWVFYSEGPMKGVIFTNWGRFNPVNAAGPLHCLGGNGIGFNYGGIWINAIVDGIYDPTNGTMSFGHIMRTNKGITTKGGSGGN